MTLRVSTSDHHDGAEAMHGDHAAIPVNKAMVKQDHQTSTELKLGVDCCLGLWYSFAK
jgi:hypothetical protein